MESETLPITEKWYELEPEIFKEKTDDFKRNFLSLKKNNNFDFAKKYVFLLKNIKQVL